MDWMKTIFDPRHPIQKADRLRFHQRHRFLIGLTISPDFGQMTGCVVEGTSAGKLLRLKALSFQELSIPLPMRRLFQQWCPSVLAPYRVESALDWPTYLSLQADLTQMAIQLVHALMSQAGQAADRVLAVAFHHCGVAVGAPDQPHGCLPLIDATAMALKTGMNVLDQFPLKDRLEGGTGWPISALPLWILWADRRSPQAFEHRVVVESNSSVQLTWLPPSDGLDATFPLIQQRIWPAADSNELRLKSYPSESNASATPIDRIVADICQQIADWQTSDSRRAAVLPPSHKLRLIIAEPNGEANPDGLQRRLMQALPESVVVPCTDYECPPWAMGALVAATHGFLHVDQVPANLPWISGTEVPRILGTLTPGAAGRYRSLLIEMSDYRPPVMTLRDAV